MSKLRTLHLLVIVISTLWLLGSFSGISQKISPIASLAIHQIYAPVCHQQPERCFSHHGLTMHLCTRCTGIYSGWLLGLIVTFFFYRNLQIRSTVLLLAAIPISADVLAYNFGMYPYQKSTALLSGFLTGIIISVFFSSNLHLLIKRKHD